ncbi:recombinase RecT [uncultured Hyphomicrobium sp.]|uniref:recombinase RecT n=1 Tax=uncultured Hyphomicrobium sp. TaxID=194373 RepID=UPI0025D75E15|nr:recombinase RecT [uncultured Hyphomicrobium sp.]
MTIKENTMTDTALTTFDPTTGQSLMQMDKKLLPAPLEALTEVAHMLAKSDILVPKAFRGKPDLCLGIAYQAALWGTDPVATAKKSYLVNDQIAYEAQLINAICLRHFDDRPTYQYAGEGAQRYVTVTARVNGQVLTYTSPRLAVIHPRNSPLWKTDPDQQLAYMAIRAFARRHMPDVLLGVYAVDELQSVQIKDVTPVAPDPFADDGAELEHVEPEEDEVTPEPSGGADYTTAQKPQERGQERQQRAPAADQPKREQWPLNDDPMEFFEMAKAAVAEANDKTSLGALWEVTEDNRRSLFRADPISSADLDEYFNKKLHEVSKP